MCDTHSDRQTDRVYFANGDAIRSFEAITIDTSRFLGDGNARWSKGPGNDLIQCLMPPSSTRGTLCEQMRADPRRLRPFRKSRNGKYRYDTIRNGAFVPVRTVSTGCGAWRTSSSAINSTYLAILPGNLRKTWDRKRGTRFRTTWD